MRISLSPYLEGFKEFFLIKEWVMTICFIISGNIVYVIIPWIYIDYLSFLNTLFQPYPAIFEMHVPE